MMLEDGQEDTHTHTQRKERGRVREEGICVNLHGEVGVVSCDGCV